MPVRRLIPVLCLGFCLLPGAAVSGPDATGFTETPLHQPTDAQEVFLTFKYRGVGTVVIAALYHDDRFYLPVTELFEVLMIPYETDLGDLVIRGTYLSQDQRYALHFNDQARLRGRVGNREIPFGADDYIIGELDFYLLPGHFSELFGLHFEINFNNLTLSLRTDNQLPVEQRMERERLRRRISERRVGYDYYPLEYGRQRKLLGGTFIDYSLNSQISDGLNQYTYNLDVGGEFMGGDVQGAILGGYNELSGFTNSSRNLRWRYVLNNRRAVSSISAGQISTRGLLSNTFRGIRVTNEPIEPRILFQNYIIDGTTLPQSEVEVYLNNSLIDYQQADEAGYYRFQVPLTYGSSRLQVVIYRPDGGREERNERVQIPYTFVRKGEFQYDVSAGRSESSIFIGTNEFWQTQASGTYGLSPWLTAKAGIEYYEPDPRYQPLAYGSISSRIASKYLVNVDAAPNAFYRANASVIYPSSVSLSASYTYFDQQGGIFNPFGTRQEVNGNIYLPFRLGNVPFSFRVSTNRQIGDFTQNTRYRADFSSRIGRLNLRFGYLDRQSGPLEAIATPSSMLTGTATYVFSRRPSMPQILKGLYLRSQVDYSPYDQQIEQVDFQLSRSVLRDGRLQLSVGKNFNNDFTFARLNFTFDFNKLRLTSSARNNRTGASYTQNIRGSVGYDHNYNKLHLSNRQQVGRAAASVRLFVDDNNSGTYDEGEQVLPYNAARISRSSSRSEMNDEGIIRLTQLQSYYRHNFEINQAAIKNPVIVPRISEFSFIADPNQFKRIDIPFYVTGIIDGTVYREVNETRQSISGVRLFLESADGTFAKELRTFSDGSFYTYEIPPDDYHLYIDPGQLDYLDAFSDPDTLSFTIEPKPDGDYIAGLEFTLKSNQFRERDIVTTGVTARADIPRITTPFETYAEYSHRVQVGSYKNRRNAEAAKATAEQQFGIPFTVIYNRTRSLHAVRTFPIQNRQQALDLLFSISTSQFHGAVLVLTDPEQTPSTRPVKENRIQIGAFSTEPPAVRHARLSRIKLDMPTSVEYDHDENLYNVFADRSNRFDTIEEQLTRIRQKGFFAGAYIKDLPPLPTGEDRAEDFDFAYQIHVQGVSQASEQAYLSRVASDTDISEKDINAGPVEELIVFKKLNDWNETLQLKQKLDRISGMGRPFIILIEKD